MKKIDKIPKFDIERLPMLVQGLMPLFNLLGDLYKFGAEKASMIEAKIVEAQTKVAIEKPEVTMAFLQLETTIVEKVAAPTIGKLCALLDKVVTHVIEAEELKGEMLEAELNAKIAVEQEKVVTEKLRQEHEQVLLELAQAKKAKEARA